MQSLGPHPDLLKRSLSFHKIFRDSHASWILGSRTLTGFDVEGPQKAAFLNLGNAEQSPI